MREHSSAGELLFDYAFESEILQMAKKAPYVFFMTMPKI